MHGLDVIIRRNNEATERGVLEISESFVDLTTDARYSDSGWYAPYTDDLGRLYRSLRSEYGRCTSRVYRDTPDGKGRPIGWVFIKRMEYEDAHRISDPAKRTYLREVWVTYRYTTKKED